MTPAVSYSVFRSLCSLLIAASIACSSHPPLELQALQAIYDATNGAHWVYYGTGKPWNFSMPSHSSYPDPCAERWEGITCSCNNKTAMQRIVLREFYPYYDLGFYTDYHAVVPNVTCSVQKLFLNKRNLTGTIANEIANLRNLTHIHLNHNSIHGTFPSGILALSNLQFLSISHNQLKGPLPNFESLPALLGFTFNHNLLTSTLPSEWSIHSRLQTIDVAFNKLHGSLPSQWSTLTQLKSMFMHFNQLSSSLPSQWSTMGKLQDFDMQTNSFTGDLPTQWASMSSLQFLNFHNNILVGTLPSTWSQLKRIIVFDVSANHLEGSIPGSWSALSRLLYLALYTNSISNTLPTTWSALTQLEYLDISGNLLSGPLLPSWSSLRKMRVMFLYSNRFDSTLPSSWSALSLLGVFDAFSNSLVGSIPSEYGNLHALQTLMLGYNYLTGAIPVSLLKLPLLSGLALPSNCLSISSLIGSNICNAVNLTALVLDGIYSGSRCGNRQLFPASNTFRGSGSGTTYSVAPKPMTAAVALPLCLFSLPRLSVLHASGAGLVGSLSSIKTLPRNLNQLVLSHNYLTGSLPTAIQLRKSWSLLDVSYNLLGGTLSPSISFSTKTVFNVSNNRLSGPLPNGLLYQPDVVILEGNQFSCPVFNYSVSLPVNDPFQSEYICDSNDFIISVLTWACMLTGTIIAGSLVVRLGLDQSALSTLSSIWKVGNAKEQSEDSSPFNLLSQVNSVEGLLRSIRTSLCMLAVLMCVYMLVYGVFKQYNYSDVTEQAAYVVSVTQLVGIVPAVVIASFYLITNLCTYMMFLYQWASFSKQPARASEGANRTGEDITALRASSITFVEILIFFFTMLINCSIVSVCNGAYVAIYSYYPLSTIRAISFAMAIFKLLWARLSVSMVNYVMAPAGNDGGSKPLTAVYRGTWYSTLLVVFNTVIIPALAVIAVSPKCARYIFESQPATILTRSFCDDYAERMKNGTIELRVTFPGETTNPMFPDCFRVQTVSTSYDNPYLYSYGCTYSLLTNYASVFSYMFALIAIVYPIVVCLLVVCTRTLTPNSWGFCLAADMLPQECLSVDHLGGYKIWAKLKFRTASGRASIHFTDTTSPIGIKSIELGDPTSDDWSVASPEPSIHEIRSFPPTTPSNIFQFDFVVVQINQLFSICLSFGIVFPLVGLLGCLALVLHTSFIQYNLRQFAVSLQNNTTRRSTEAYVGLWKVLNQDCDLLQVALLKSLVIPFVAAYCLKSFFLFEIVGVAYPFQVNTTIALPLTFLSIGFLSWQTLKLSTVKQKLGVF